MARGLERSFPLKIGLIKLGFIASLMAGCESTANDEMMTSPRQDHGAATSGSPASSNEVDPPTITVTGRVQGLFAGDGLSGVTVCLDEVELCASSGDDGTYRLSRVPAGRDVILRFDLADHMGATVPYQTPDEDGEVPPVSLVPDTLIETQFELVKVKRQPGLGLIVFGVSNGINGDGINVANATVYLEPIGTDRVYYTNDAGLPDADLTSTSKNGGGVMVNLPPSQYAIRYQSPASNCTIRLGWGTTDDARLIVEADRVTIVRLECLGET